jgi:MtN3 and saliva related transmembrane protein
MASVLVQLQWTTVMDARVIATVLGAFAATSSTIAFVPQIAKIRKTGGQDVSYSMLSLYIGGVTLWLWYGLIIGATALSIANAASIVFAGTCLVLKFMKSKRSLRRTEKRHLHIQEKSNKEAEL